MNLQRTQDKPFAPEPSPHFASKNFPDSTAQEAVYHAGLAATLQSHQRNTREATVLPVLQTSVARAFAAPN